MTAIPAEVAAELTRLRAEDARLLRLLKLTPRRRPRACAGGADLQVTITGLNPEASAAAIDARLGRQHVPERAANAKAPRLGSLR